MSSVFVTNTNSFAHEDRYDGVTYRFPVKERVLVPIPAAEHMLGYKIQDKTDTLVRLGWATKYDPKTRAFTENEEGIRQLARFVFEDAVMQPKSLVKELA